MVTYILKRIVTLFLVFLGLAILIFVIARIVPGDPARIALGPLASAQQVEEMRQEMGLNDPFFVHPFYFALIWTDPEIAICLFHLDYNSLVHTL